MWLVYIKHSVGIQPQIWHFDPGTYKPVDNKLKVLQYHRIDKLKSMPELIAEFPLVKTEEE
jgi:hypothetical protein